MKDFADKLKAFFHDPIDKCFDIRDHENRARRYAEKLDVSNIEEIEGPDHFSSCMERSLFPKEKVYQDFNQIRHPLSEKKIDISVAVDRGDVFNSVESAFENIKDTFLALDDKSKFLCLWRNLQEEVMEKLKGKPWAKYLSVLPADTRIPDHSIWEHLKIATAVNVWLDKESRLLLQDNSLLIFTIGPVQAFISQARKSQDFYMGSFILSFLTFRAMEAIIENYGPTSVIYPDLYKQPLMDWWLKKNLNLTPKEYNELDLQIPTIPNRFVAIIPKTNYGQIKKLAEEMKDRIKKTIASAKEVIFKEFKINEKLTDEMTKKVESQFSEFPEIYWAAVPWKIKEKDISFDDLSMFLQDEIIEKYQKLWEFTKNYGEHNPNIAILYELLYTVLEESMGARKNVRVFKPQDIEEKGRKCTVCGEKDVVFFSERENKEKFTRYNTPTLDLTDSIEYKFLSNGEGLCAVCLLKRTFEVYLKKEVSKATFDKLTFPSTAEIACTDWKEKAIKCAEDEFKEYVEKLRESLKEKFQEVSPLPKLKEIFEALKNPEGQYFYKENLKASYFEKEFGNQISESEIEELRKCLRNIYDKIKQPKFYYAIIHLDADNMGKWLSGELLPDIEHAYNSQVWNEKISQGFKRQLKEVLNRKPLTPAIHASISTALRNYAIEFVRKIVEEEHLGKLVYAGGDDVLAFVNLNDLFDVMNKLRWAFSGNIKIENGGIKVDSEKEILNESNGFVEKDGSYLLTMGPKATVSAGVVIVHYKTPLQIVIKKVFEMEKMAKETGKDAFAICLMKRSGGERVAKAKWSYETCDKRINTLDLFAEIANAFDENNEKGYIAKSFIYKLENQFARLKGDEGEFLGIADIFNAELKRLIERSYNGKKEEEKSFVEKIHKIMKELFWESGGNINNFLNICKIATFISKAED